MRKYKKLILVLLSILSCTLVAVACSSEQETFTVTFDTQGGSTVERKIVYGSGDIIGKPNAPTKEGYTFKGWYADKNGTVEWDFSSPITSNITIYACWTGITFEMYYRDVGDTYFDGDFDGDYPQTHTYGTVTELVEPSMDGHYFVGWYSDALASGEPITAIDATAYNANFTIYAKWKPFETIVSFNSNGGTGTMDDDIAFFDIDAVFECTFERAGYTFRNWNTQADGEGDEYWTFTNLSKVDGDTIILYAQWKANENTISYNPNGGMNSSLMGDHKAFTDADVGLKENEFSRTGYKFSGWATSAEGDAVYTDEATIQMPPVDNLVLYAKWTPISNIKVSFDTNSSDNDVLGSAEDIYVTYDSAYGTLPIVSRVGYTFNNWFLSGAEITSSSEVKRYSEHTLTASWTALERTALFLVNTPSDSTSEGTVDSVDSKTAQSISIPTNAYSTVGYNFLGWCLDAGGNDTIFQANDSFKIPAIAESELNFYAVWERKVYKVTLDPDGGEVKSESTKSAPVKVSFDLNGGLSGKPATQTVTADSPLVYPETIPTHSSSTTAFTGWYAQPSGGTPFDFTADLASDITLYAQWVSCGTHLKGTTDPIYFYFYDTSASRGEQTYFVAYKSGTISMEYGTYQTNKSGIQIYTSNNSLVASISSSEPYDSFTATAGAIYYIKQNSSNLQFGEGMVRIYGRTLPLDGGLSISEIQEFSIEYKANISEIASAERDGFTFGGWFTEQDGQGQEMGEIADIIIDTKYYAYWIPEQE